MLGIIAWQILNAATHLKFDQYFQKHRNQLQEDDRYNNRLVWPC